MNATAQAFAEETTLQSTVLNAGRIREIQEGLGSYARLSGALEAALLDASGAVLVRWEDSERSAELDALGVLATASFSATQALAQQLGDTTFGGICHQGKQHCLYVAPLLRGYMLLTLHPVDARIQDMRQSLVRIVPRLNQQLAGQGPPADRQPVSHSQM